MKRIVGDTVPINGVSYIDANTPLDWTTTGYTPKMVIETTGGTVSLAATSITAHPTQTVTLDSTNNWITCNDHGFSVGDQVVFATSGSLGALTAATRYHIVERDPNWFKVSLTSGGSAIAITAGSGTNTVYRVGSWQATNAQCSFSSLTAGTYRFWVAAYNGATQVETAPATQEGSTLEVLPQGN